MTHPFPVIAIDGPAASGKSSVARALAARMGWLYVNSGAFYRATTWSVLTHGLDPADEGAVANWSASADLKAAVCNGQARLLINETDPEPHLHEEAVNRHVSLVSRVPQVRNRITTLLRSLSGPEGVVMEGRDIGTAVFPEAPFKFYIDASPEVRARRRALQGQADDLVARDRIDSQRTTAPLAVAPDAVVIDSSGLTIDAVVNRFMEHLASHRLPSQALG